MKCPSLLKPRKINYPSKQQSNQSKMTSRQHQPKTQQLTDKSCLDQSQIIRQKKYYLANDNSKPYIIGNKQNLNHNNHSHRGKSEKFQSSSTKQLPMKNQGKELFLKNYGRELTKKDNYNSRTRLSVIQEKAQNDVKTKKTSRIYRNQSMCLSRNQWDNDEQRPSRNVSVLGFKQSQKEKIIDGEKIMVRQSKGMKREVIQQNCGLVVTRSERNICMVKTNQKPNRGEIHSSKFIVNPKKQTKEESKQYEDNIQKLKSKEVKQNKIRRNKESDQINLEEIRDKEVMAEKGNENSGRVRNQAKRHLEQGRKSKQTVQSKEMRTQLLMEQNHSRDFPSLPRQSDKRACSFQQGQKKVTHSANRAPLLKHQSSSMANIRRSRLQWLIEISRLYQKGRSRIAVNNVIDCLEKNLKQSDKLQCEGYVEGEQQITLEELVRFIRDAIGSLRDDDTRNVNPSDGMISFYQVGQVLFSTPCILSYLNSRKQNSSQNKANYTSEPCRSTLSHKEEEQIVETARFQVHEGQQQQIEGNRKKRRCANIGNDKRGFKGVMKMKEGALQLEKRSFGRKEVVLEEPCSQYKSQCSPITKPNKSSVYEVEQGLQEISQILVQDPHCKKLGLCDSSQHGIERWRNSGMVDECRLQSLKMNSSQSFLQSIIFSNLCQTNFNLSFCQEPSLSQQSLMNCYQSEYRARPILEITKIQEVVQQLQSLMGEIRRGFGEGLLGGSHGRVPKGEMRVQDLDEIEEFMRQFVEYKVYRRECRSGRHDEKSGNGREYFNAVKLSGSFISSQESELLCVRMLQSGLIGKFLSYVSAIKMSQWPSVMPQLPNILQRCNNNLLIINLAGNQISQWQGLIDVIDSNREVLQFLNLNGNRLGGLGQLFYRGKEVVGGRVEGKQKKGSGETKGEEIKLKGERRVFPSLRELHLKSNRIQQLGCYQQSLNQLNACDEKSLPCLQILDLRSNLIPPSQLSQLEDLIDQSPALHILSLKDNPINSKDHSTSGHQLQRLLNQRGIYEYESLQVMSAYIKYKDVTFEQGAEWGWSMIQDDEHKQQAKYE